MLYVFTARKRRLLLSVSRQEAPDTLLFGLNHVSRHGIDADFHEPEYGRAGRLVARQVGRLGPDVLQLRTLPRFADYDVVFLTGAWPLLLAAQAIPAQRRPKLVWLNMTLTNVIRSGGPVARVVAAAVQRADRIVCIAEFQRRFLHERLQIPYGRLPLVLSGTDAAFYDPDRVGTPIDRTDVLAAGRDAARDYRTLFAALDSTPLAARVVCSPRNLAGLTTPNGVSVRYDIPQTDLRAEYAAADAVVVPTHGDGSTVGSDCSGTLVLLDALAMGRPAVITAGEPVADYITPGTHARTVAPGDSTGLRAELLALRDDPVAATRMARAGQERARQALTSAHFAERVAAVFEEVISTR
ncbi:MAG: glycosyltransferase family 4 protein [Chloroflexota bacterium]